MVTLNTMFKLHVNNACNTSCLVPPIISDMHPQMERLYRAAKELKKIGSQAELARALNQSSQTVNNWEARGISKAGLVKAQAEIGCSAMWLVTGEGAMVPGGSAAVATTQQPFDQNVKSASMGMRPIPVISAVQAGALTDMESPYPVGAGYAYEYTDQDLSAWAFALDIEGLSMMPEFRPGDRIIIEPELEPNPGDFVVARNGSQQATFKKYRPRGMNASGNMVFELVPLNEDFPTLRSDIEHLTVIGVMTEHRKKYRRT